MNFRVVAAVKPKAGSIWAKAVQTKDAWNCSACLSENAADLTECGACGAARDGKTKVRTRRRWLRARSHPVPTQFPRNSHAILSPCTVYAPGSCE